MPEVLYDTGSRFRRLSISRVPDAREIVKLQLQLNRNAEIT